jgi:hypothetical protein
VVSAEPPSTKPQFGPLFGQISGLARLAHPCQATFERRQRDIHAVTRLSPTTFFGTIPKNHQHRHVCIRFKDESRGVNESLTREITGKSMEKRPHTLIKHLSIGLSPPPGAISNIITIGFLNLLFCLPATIAGQNNLFLADPQLQLYHNSTRTCAITSTYHLLRELGQGQSLSEIEKSVEIDYSGSTGAAVCRYLEALNVPYVAVKTDDFKAILSCLRPNKRGAILHFDKQSHFVAVKKNDDGSFALFDGASVIQNNVPDVLAERFSGSAILAGNNVRCVFYARSVLGNAVVFDCRSDGLCFGQIVSQ